MTLEKLIERLNLQKFIINKEVTINDNVDINDISKGFEKANFLVFYIMNIEKAIIDGEQLRQNAVERKLVATVDGEKINIQLV